MDPHTSPGEVIHHVVAGTSKVVLDILGPTVEFLTSPAAAHGDFCVMRGMIPPGVAVPLHSHDATEVFFVLSGSKQVLTLGSGPAEWVDVRAGDYVHVPRGTRHAHRNVSDEPLIELVITTARLGNWFEEVGTPATGAPRPPAADDLERFLAASGKYGYWLGSPEDNAAAGLRMLSQSTVPSASMTSRAAQAGAASWAARERCRRRPGSWLPPGPRPSGAGPAGARQPGRCHACGGIPESGPSQRPDPGPGPETGSRSGRPRPATPTRRHHRPGRAVRCEPADRRAAGLDPPRYRRIPHRHRPGRPGHSRRPAAARPARHPGRAGRGRFTVPGAEIALGAVAGGLPGLLRLSSGIRNE